jgi:hopanoid-associated phosphorylase
MNETADTLRAAPLAEPSIAALDAAIESATEALVSRQNGDGHWVFALEADVTIPAEYILLMHYLDEIDTTKAYYALKLAGDDIEAPHMVRARQTILGAGGAARCNVFTRIALALFAQVPWRAVPVMPVEIMSLPKWFPFHLNKVSYWSRTVIVPLLVLMTLKPQAKNPRQIGVAELFVTPPFEEKRYLHAVGRNFWATAFRWVDHIVRFAEPSFPKKGREKAIERAMEFTLERLNGEDGLGAIFPAMANAVMAMELMGFAKDDPRLVTAKIALKKLIITDADGDSMVQPCVSPVWDTGLAGHAMLEVGDLRNDGKAAGAGKQAAAAASDWLASKQILDVVGDYNESAPGVRPGGWAFQYANAHYPDVDDTAAVVMAIDRAGDPKHRENIERRLGRVRCRQRALLSELHSVRRPWRALGPADRRRQCPLHLDAGAARIQARQSCRRQGCGLSLARAGAGRVLVRPLGHQLHLRYLVGAVRAQCRRRGPCVSRHAEGEGLSRLEAERRRRLGRGRHQLLRRPSRRRQRLDRVTDRLGGARPDGGRRRRSSVGPARHRLPDAYPARGRPVARGYLYGGRIPARVLSALPRLSRLFPADGAGAVPQPEDRQFQARHARHVSLVATHLGILAGLQSEARCLSGLTVPNSIALSGARLDGARRAAERLVADGATHLLSFGLAGGLDPALAPGTLLLPTSVLDRDRTWPVDAAWHGRAKAQLGALTPLTGPLYGSDEAIADPDAKARLHARTGALAVDMESHVLASAAAGLPLLVIRVVADGAADSLPPAALAAVRPDGTTALAAVLGSLLRQPAQLPRLMRLGRAAKAAEQTLRAAVTLGASTGFGLSAREV